MTDETDSQETDDRNSEEIIELEQRISELEGKIEDLTRRITSVEGLYTDRVLEREHAHTKAKKQDATEKISRGDTHNVVIERFTENGRAITHIEGIVTFITNWEPADKGDTIKIKIVDVGENAANAMRVTQSNDEGQEE